MINKFSHPTFSKKRLYALVVELINNERAFLVIESGVFDLLKLSLATSLYLSLHTLHKPDKKDIYFGTTT